MSKTTLLASAAIIKAETSPRANTATRVGTMFEDIINEAVPYKVYKALLSQNAPVATTTDPTMIAGQIWTLEAYNAADAATIAALELVSGTLYAVGSKYRSATDQTLSVDAATTFSYDGSPYIVSTDVNGDFNPFVNTLGGNPVYSWSSAGNFIITLSGAFAIDKTSFSTTQVYSSITRVAWIDVNSISYITLDLFDTGADDLLYYTPFEIEVYA